MAKQPNNIVMKSTQGIFGDQVVFKIWKGIPIVAAPPQVNKNRPVKPEEAARRLKFKNAGRYCKMAMGNPALRAIYEAAATGDQMAGNLAFQDHYYAPEVSLISKENYLGLSTDTILVKATDNFKVTRVKVTIHTPSGELLEEGNAVQDENTENWIYTVTGENEEAIGSRIKATAYDLAGNEGVLEITV